MLREADNTTYIICGCETMPEDISMEIMNESTGISPDTGLSVPVVTMQTTLHSFNIKNWNERIYDDGLVMESLDGDGMIQMDMSKGQWMGEFGHPLDLSVRRQMILNPPTVSHRILKYWKEGRNLLKGITESVPYGYGLAMAANAKRGIPAAYSLRSLGSIDLQTRKVKRPLKIITYDYVYRPSHREAYEDKILTESAGIYIPTQYEIGDIMTESAVYTPVLETCTTEQIETYIKERSDNVAKIAEMFKLDNFNTTLHENGTRVTIVTADYKLDIPVEKMINMQYADVLNLQNRKK